MDFKGGKTRLKRMSHNLENFQKLRWHESWKSVVLKMLEQKLKDD